MCCFQLRQLKHETRLNPCLGKPGVKVEDPGGFILGQRS